MKLHRLRLKEAGPLKLKWKPEKGMPMSMTNELQAVVIGNNVYVGGGITSSTMNGGSYCNGICCSYSLMENIASLRESLFWHGCSEQTASSDWWLEYI